MGRRLLRGRVQAVLVGLAGTVIAFIGVNVIGNSATGRLPAGSPDWQITSL